jgi:hypothetical protein
MTSQNHISGEFVRRRAQSGHWCIGSHAPAQALNVRSNSTFGVAARAGLPENAPAKAIGVDGGARFLKTHPVTNPVVDPISLGWYFDDPVFLKDLTFTLAGEIDRNVIPTRVATPTLSLAEK